ncbi:MAG: hypothetical protein KDN22_14000 [Verrucomicrobiae bacterium]|nr:hypothetical protein [Verrucomicrobiae bacterium]
MIPHTPSTTTSGSGRALRWVMMVFVLVSQVFSACADDDDHDDENDHSNRRTIPLNVLPKPVASTLTSVASGIKVTEAKHYESQAIFEFEGTLHGSEIELKIHTDGTLLAVDYDSEENERTVPISTIPREALTAIRNYYPDFGIEKAKLSTINGLDLYEVEGYIGREGFEVYVTGSGDLFGDGRDSDHDGLPDLREPFYGCDPDVADSDGDMFPDGFETAHGTDPANAAATPELLSIVMQDNGATAGDAVVLSVTTFQGGLFDIQHCSNATDWVSMGISIVGDNQTHEIVMPASESGECGYFRVAISDAATIMESPIGGGIGTSPTVFAPESLEGTSFEVNLGDDGEKEMQFDGGSRGQVVERDDRWIEVTPFTYRYKRTSATTATVTVTFPRSGDDLVVDYELEFTADGKGKIVKSTQRSDSGTFSYRNRP